MKSRIRLFLSLVVIIAAVGSFWLIGADPDGVEGPADPVSVTSPQVPPAVQEASGTASSDLAGRASSVSIPEQLPASLAGTSVPEGWARTDRLGNLIPTPHLRQLFEYFLSALGEESLQQLVARIQAALSVLDEPARSQALAT